MATQARVTSTEAIDAFRSSLIVFMGKAHRSVDDVGDQVKRMRQWLQLDQRVHWEGEMRRRTKDLEQAQQELMSARINRNSDSAMQARQAAVNKAQRAIGEAEQKVRAVKKWSQNYDTTVDPLNKRLENLCQFLDQDMPKAVAHLANIQKLLEGYASAPMSDSGGAPVTAVAEAEPVPGPEV